MQPITIPIKALADSGTLYFVFPDSPTKIWQLEFFSRGSAQISSANLLAKDVASIIDREIDDDVQIIPVHCTVIFKLPGGKKIWQSELRS